MSSDQEIAPMSSGQAATAPDAEPALGKGPLELVVTRVEDLTPRIRRFELRAPGGGPLPPWTPGAHIKVPVVIDGADGTRCYSLLGDCEKTDVYEIAVLRIDDGGGGSRHVHQTFREGMHLRCEPPSNHFELEAGNRPSVLIAGGIGITPLRSMAIALDKRGAPFDFHFATRTPGETPFLDDLKTRFGERVRFWHSDVPAPNLINLEETLKAAPAGTVFYVCGPSGLIRAAVATGASLGLPSDRIRFELFTPVAPAAGDQPLDVELKRSGIVVHVPASQSILDAVLDAGIDADHGCCAGQCGTCAVRVIEGEADHRDDVLSETERTADKLMCICVSRAKGPRLVIDL